MIGRDRPAPWSGWDGRRLADAGSREAAAEFKGERGLATAATLAAAPACRRRRRGSLALGSLILAALAAGANARAAATLVSDLRVSASGPPAAGDHRLLAMISPNGDDHRDAAAVRFFLHGTAAVRLEVRRADATRRLVYSASQQLGAGRHRFVWAPPASTDVGTYIVEVRTRGTRSGRAAVRAVVRVRGVDASFARASYAPGEVAVLTLTSDARRVSLQVLELGPERGRTNRNDELNGIAVGDPVELRWGGPRDRTRRVLLRVGAWRSGLYAARLTADDGRVGYAPFVVRAPRLGGHRVAVALPTLTWQAYNFWDAEGDGAGDTWYAKWLHPTVRLDRPYLNRGVPPKFRRYDLPFLHWLHWSGRRADFFAEEDLRLVTGSELAAAYDLSVFPGHHEYVTAGMYDAVERYRDLGGNLMFLSANSFYWRVVGGGRTMERSARWRELGRPEARLLGVQYRASDKGERRRPFVVRRAPAAEWIFAGTGLEPGIRFGSFGIEIDAKTSASPRGTQVLAEIPHLLGNGRTAQMTYYETGRGARVFAAGALDFSASALVEPVSTILDNLWARLADQEPEREPAAATAAALPVGALEPRPAPTIRNRTNTIALSPDGRHAYVGAGWEAYWSTLAVFRRDPKTGTLTRAAGRPGCVKHSAYARRNGCESGGQLNEPRQIVVPRDGRQVLTTNAIGGLLLAYRRDARTGALRLAACGERPACQLGARAMPRPTALAVSPDGRSVYVASPIFTYRGLAVFGRSPATGAIVQLGGEDGCIQRLGNGGPGDPCARPVIDAFAPRDVAVSPDGRHVYVVSRWANEDRGVLLAFARDPRSGALTPLPGEAACIGDLREHGNVCGSASGLERAESIALSPDGRQVYVGGTILTVFARSSESGALRQVPRACIRGGAPCPGGRVAFSADGRSAYVASAKGFFALSRDRPTGTLRSLGSYATRVPYATSVAISPDGRNVYATDGGIRVFRRVQ